MGMYNMIFGQNPASDFLLGLLDLTRSDVGRFRDCFVTESGEEIAVYTRNGGGNRDHWEDDGIDYGVGCPCTGCVIEYRLPAHPLYLRDEDDEFDCTYATVYFSVPEAARALVKDLAEKRDPNALWITTLEELKSGKRPEVVEKFRPLMEQIAQALKPEAK